MTISKIIQVLETTAPLVLQEAYDNAGLITGDPATECTGIMTCLDATEEVVIEAISRNCNLVVAHHPIIFRGLKKITGKNYVERTIISAIKNDMAIYAIHTNLDNIIDGVNGRIADKIGLVNRNILVPKERLLQKLAVFVPVANKQGLLEALFAAGAGNIGHYSECSFSTAGTGSFKGDGSTDPFVGKPGERHYEKEEKVEVIFPVWLRTQIVHAMKNVHPYEEVAYDIYDLENQNQQTGSGICGELEEQMEEKRFLKLLKDKFKLSVIRHTALTGKIIKKVAICGGAGSFLTGAAIGAQADAYITSDVKYHEFFDADNKILLADIGHFESEQFTIDLLFDILRQNFPNFAVLKTGVQTNPVQYFY
ncbi:MAG: Nif3-like dinuclear metal center hexameric protein [Ferruginibacter sp.]